MTHVDRANYIQSLMLMDTVTESSFWLHNLQGWSYKLMLVSTLSDPKKEADAVSLEIISACRSLSRKKTCSRRHVYVAGPHRLQIQIQVHPVLALLIRLTHAEDGT